MKNKGTVVFGLKAERRVSHASAPCSGYYDLVEYTSRDSTAKINSPSMYDLLKRALGTLPEFGSEFSITVSVVVTKRAKRSVKKCHNTWPAHYCPQKKSKKVRR